MSKFAHIPWAVGVQLLGLALLLLAGMPHALIGQAAWVTGLGGFAVGFAREVTQEEYRYIEAHGGLRANMPDLQGFKVWQWNRHSIDETAISGLAVFLIALALTLIRIG